MRRRILVVDDQAMNRMLMRSILQSDFEVLEAGNGFAALRILEEEHSTISAILLDIVMPQLDGFGVMEKIRSNPDIAQIPIIVLTGSGGTDTEERALEAGAIDYVIKPCNPVILKNRLWNTIRFGEQAAIMNETRMDVLSDLYGRSGVFERTKEMIFERMALLEKDNSNDSDAFWNTKSIDSIIFSSYVGGACIFEYQTDKFKIIRVNEKYLKIMFGNSEISDEELQTVWEKRLGEQAKNSAFNAIKKAVETKGEVADEIELKGLYDLEKPVYIRAILRVIAQSGSRYLFYCVIEDVTAQKEAEKNEKLAMQQLQIILKEMNGGVSARLYDENGEGRMIFANDRYYEQRGYTREQYEREVKSIFDLVSPEVAEEMRNQNKVVHEGGVCEPQEYRIKRRDGSFAWLRSRMTITQISGYDSPLQISISADITSEMETLAKEKDTNTLMQMILDNVANGVTAVALDGNKVEYLFANEKYYSMLGYTREQYQTEVTDTYMIFHPDDRGKIFEAVQKLTPEDKPLVLEYRAFRRDCTEIKVRMVIVSKEYHEGQLLQLSVFEDITEESREEEHQKDLIENLPCGAGIFDIVDSDIRCVYLNKKYWQLVGREPNADEHYSAFKSVHEEDRPYLREVLQSIITSGKEQEGELRVLHGDGHYIPFLVRGNIIKYKSGKMTLYVTYTSIAEDALTFRKMLPVALETMMSSSQDLSFVKDRSLTYACASKAFAKMVGLEHEREVIGKTDYDIFSKELADKYTADDRSLLSSGKSIIDNIECLPSADGNPRYSSTSKYLLRDSLGNIIGLYGTGRDVTEDREAYKRLQLLTDTIPGGLVTYEVRDNEVRTLYISDGVSTITGYSKQDYELSKNNLINFIVDEDKHLLQEQLNRLVNDGAPIDCVYRIKKKDGTTRWINLRGIESGRSENAVTISAVIFDVEEKKQADIKLGRLEYENRKRYEHELQLRKGLIQDSFLYYQVNLTTGALEEFTSKADIKVDTSAGNSFDSYIHSHVIPSILPADLPVVKNSLFPDALRESYEIGVNSVSAKYRRLTAKNEYHWVQMDAFMMKRPDNGNVVAFLHCKDIDKEQKASLSVGTILNGDIESVININVKNGTASITHMLDSINAFRVRPDVDFVFEQLFDVYCEKLVLEQDRSESRKFFNLKSLTERLKSEKYVTCVYRIEDKQGVRRKSTNAYYLDEMKDVIVLTGRDITELYEEEQRQKKKLQAAVDKANQANEAKSDFISHMSHDIRTPLNAIMAYSNEVLMENADEKKLRDYMNKINVSGEYLLGIVNDVLDMSRIEHNRIKLNPEPYMIVDFENTIHNVIDELSKDKDITFIMDASKVGASGVMVDHVRFNQIFINLLSNAVKFTPRGGKVEFIIKELSETKNKVIKRFIVRDNGIGMSKEFLPRAFESFNQEFRKDNKEKTQGTGLGLTIVKELVKLMGGTIDLQSELNVGTTFTIDIPFESTETFEHKSEKSIYDYDKLIGTRILLAEDGEINTEIAVALLEKHGCKVEHAANGEIACNMFKDSPVGYYQLILMDIRMPVLDGISATKEIRAMARKDAKSTPIIAMTADAFNEDEQIAFSAGMNAHVSKPINPTRLFDACCENLKV